MTSAITHGIVLGFLLGKPLGILLFSWVAVRLGLASLPQSVRWVQVLGVGIMGGIGFTVALYVNALAFESASRVDAGEDWDPRRKPVLRGGCLFDAKSSRGEGK